MLPGFRFLSVAVMLAVSMLIFGLGAAALLRATHEEFASLPLKQLPEVTFGSREETQQPTLAVLQVDTPAANPAEQGPDQAETQHPVAAAVGAEPESTAAAPPAANAPAAADAPSAATDSATPAASPAPSDPVPPPAADTAPSPDAASTEPSEPSPPSVETSVEPGDAVKPDIAKTDVPKSDAAKSDVRESDVAETMTSPFGEHFRPPLPESRPAAQAADLTPPAAKRSSAKPPHVAKRHRHRRVVRRPRRVRPVAPNLAPSPASPFDTD